MTDKNKDFELSDELLKSALYDEMLLEMEKEEKSLKEAEEFEHKFSDDFKSRINALIDEACAESSEVENKNEACNDSDDNGRASDIDLSDDKKSGEDHRKIIRIPYLRKRSLAAAASLVFVAGAAFLTLRVNYSAGSYESTAAAAAYSMDNQPETAAENSAETGAEESSAKASDGEAGAAMLKSGRTAPGAPADTSMKNSDMKAQESYEEAGISEASADTSAASVNPLKEVQSKNDFISELGIRLSEPSEGAENVSCSIISDSIAQINYYSENLAAEVTLRAVSSDAGMSGKELSGVYYEFDESGKRTVEEPVTLSGDSESVTDVSVTIEYALSDDGTKKGALVIWSVNGCDYSLWAESQDLGDEELLSEAKNVIESSAN